MFKMSCATEDCQNEGIPIHPIDPTLKYPFVKDILRSPEEMIAILSRQYYESKFNINPRLITMARGYDHFQDDSVSCHFTEDIRVHCHQMGARNYVEIWKQTSPEILRSFKTADDFRNYAYLDGGRECGLFSVPLGMHLYLDYRNGGDQRPIKILDPSAGWGDRMIAAIACGDSVAEYHGYDPNPILASRYQKIIDRLDTSKKCSYTTAPFELAKIPKGYYDLAMTSPPFFELEVYSSHEDQSIEQYKTYPEWLKKFYIPYLLNMRYGVRPGGTIIIYVSDYTSKGKQYHLQEETVNIMTRRANGVTLRTTGWLKTKQNDIGRPFFVFDVNE